MQDKHKVTLYLPPELHKQLKIKAAVESEAMSAIAERALVFYLTHSDVVDETEGAHGHVHQIYSCPGCEGLYVIRDGNLTSLMNQPGILNDEELSVTQMVGVGSQGEEELVPC